MQITRNLPFKDSRGEACACLAWVKANIRYVKDIRAAEVLHDPVTLLGYPGYSRGIMQHVSAVMAGDCDDMALLLSALLESIGHRTRFVAIAYRPDSYSHVWLQDDIGRKWLDLEPTEPIPCGARVPKGLSEIYQEV